MKKWDMSLCRFPCHLGHMDPGTVVAGTGGAVVGAAS